MSPFSSLEATGRFSAFAGRCLPAALGAARRPADLLRQLHAILLGALPLGLVAGLSLGVVAWIHLHGVVSREHSQQVSRKVPEYLALAVVLEFAPLGAGLVVAGRSGASLGAELGAMRLTEQLDALEVMGLSPLRYLVGPRVLAAMIALPVLTIYIAAVAILGSFAAEMLGGNLSWTMYQGDVLRGIGQAQPVSSTLKTVVFGYLVAATGCYCGLNAKGGAEGVGQAATRGVVAATLLVLLANVALVKVIQILS